MFRNLKYPFSLAISALRVLRKRQIIKLLPHPDPNLLQPFLQHLLSTAKAHAHKPRKIPIAAKAMPARTPQHARLLHQPRAQDAIINGPATAMEPQKRRRARHRPHPLHHIVVLHHKALEDPQVGLGEGDVAGEQAVHDGGRQREGGDGAVQLRHGQRGVVARSVDARRQRRAPRRHPPHADARQRVRLRQGPRCQRVGGAERQQRWREGRVQRRGGVEDRPVDFVGEDGDGVGGGEGHDGLEQRFGEDGARRVVRVVDDDHFGFLRDQSF